MMPIVAIIPNHEMILLGMIFIPILMYTQQKYKRTIVYFAKTCILEN